MRKILSSQGIIAEALFANHQTNVAMIFTTVSKRA